MSYKERKKENGKYRYLHECPSCTKERWTSNAKSGKCSKCAGKESYTPPSVERKDKRKYGDGYITKQGYHLVYTEEGYKPAHRLAFPELPKDHVVHHVDGDKLNNKIENLHPCSKKEHREIHGQLERLSYLLIQQGLIVFKDGKYFLSTSMEQFMLANSVNSGEAVASDVDGNPEPSPVTGRCNDYPLEEYTQASGSAEHP